MGRGAGADGGTAIAEGTIHDIEKNPDSVIEPYLSGAEAARNQAKYKADFSDGIIRRWRKDRCLRFAGRYSELQGKHNRQIYLNYDVLFHTERR